MHSIYTCPFLQEAARGFVTTVISSLALSASIFSICWRRFRSVSREQRSRLNEVQVLQWACSSSPGHGATLFPWPSHPVYHMHSSVVVQPSLHSQAQLQSTAAPRAGAKIRSRPYRYCRPALALAAAPATQSQADAREA
eukprot:scaffold51563_cov31-Tisochrysis_lutea.AAC.3